MAALKAKVVLLDINEAALKQVLFMFNRLQILHGMIMHLSWIITNKVTHEVTYEKFKHTIFINVMVVLYFDKIDHETKILLMIDKMHHAIFFEAQVAQQIASEGGHVWCYPVDVTDKKVYI